MRRMADGKFMKLIYNNFDFSGIGEISIAQAREMEGPADQPQRAQVTLRVRVDIFAGTYDQSRELIEQGLTALETPNATLQWRNDAAGVDYVNQPATLTGSDIPEEWGEYHQVLALVFTYYEQTPGGAANNIPLTFQTTGSGAPVAFDVVNKWTHAAAVERFSSLRRHRKQTRARIHVEGQWFGDTTQPLATRRAALTTQAAAFNTGMAGADGVLTFGDGGSVFQGTVRIEEWACDVDQAVNEIAFSFTASYTLFPDESDYATAEFNVEEKDPATGELTLAITGKVQSQDEAGAQAKVAAILQQVLGDRDYLATGQQLDLTTTADTVSANADGDTFIELTFAASYRKWKATNQPATFTGATATAVTLGNVNKWRDHLSFTRYSALRKQRQLGTETIEAAGVWAADMTLELPDRRAQLLARQQALRNEVNVAEGTLAYGGWSQTVRVTEFMAEIDQAETGITWSLTATYTLFPDETDYALADFEVEEKDNFTGELTLAINGRIQSQDEAGARAKLAAVLAQVLADRDYAALGQQTEGSSSAKSVSADVDGDAFIELSFTAAYRKWKTTNQPATFRGATGKAVSFGNVNKWRDHLSFSRFNPLRSHRERVVETIDAAGTWRGDLSLTLADRRKQLLKMQRAMRNEVNVAQGTLVYGDWSQVVRVTEFSAEINQAETGIDWSITGTYTLFPDESDYTLAEVTAAERDNFTGELQLNVGGKIQSDSEAHARTKLAAVLAALVSQYGYTTGQQLAVEATAATLSVNSDAGGDGDTFTELSFTASYRRWKPTNQKATFTKTGSKTAVPFGNVRQWRDHYAATRFNEMRSQRRHATGSVDAAGTWCADLTLSLKDRRAQLLAMQRRMKAEVNCADGKLVYGDWNQVVRVDDLQAEINSAETGIDWSLTASYSLFPNEGGYATAEFSVAQRESVEEGDEFLTFAGRVAAPNGSAARAKLTSLRTSVLATYGWTLAQRLRDEASVSVIDANGDRTAGVAEGIEAADTTGFSFIELSFSEEYRRRMAGTLVSSTLSVSSREDVPSQQVLTTYAGSVTATGPNADAAFATALAQAQALGANREGSIDTTAVLRSSTISQERRQTTADNAQEFIRLSFSFEYQSKLSAGRAFIEMTTTVAQDIFGVDTETCQGFVAARDTATAQAIYLDQILSLYAGRVLHTEQTGVATTRFQQGDGWQEEPVRFDFSITAFSPKAFGRVAMNYSIEVARDFLTLEMRTVVQGSCFAVNRAAADAAVTTLLGGLNLGNSIRSRRNEDREFTSTVGVGALTVMKKLDFEEEFAGRVTGVAGVIEMHLTESVVYSGTRWSVQNMPYEADGSGGVSIPQPSGVEPGSRSISGSVTAATLATAQAWAYKQRAMLTGDANGNRYPQPPHMDTDYNFVPRIDGIATGPTANVQLYRVNFQFAEILPLYPAPA